MAALSTSFTLMSPPAASIQGPISYAVPQQAIPLSLLFFNIGVELGLLAVIALAFLTVGLWFAKRDWYRHVVVMTGSAMIAVIGLYWTWDRIEI